MQWPEGKAFAFTVFDDTDNSTVANTKPVYDLLFDLGFLTTKSVWVYPSKGQFSGQSLSDPVYLKWIHDLQSKGFEIGLHNVGDGFFTRDEILHGIELFHEHLGIYPRIHSNHKSNYDNIYWQSERFNWPYNHLYRVFQKMFRGQSFRSLGNIQESPCFWGDVCKKHIDYIRNYTCMDINTLEFNPSMPYIDVDKLAYSNRWFSSSDGHTAHEFCALANTESLERLMSQGGACIVYTHFASGFVDSRGNVLPLFRKKMEHLASLNGFFKPASTILDHLRTHQQTTLAYQKPSTTRWLVDRIIKKARYRR